MDFASENRSPNLEKSCKSVGNIIVFCFQAILTRQATPFSICFRVFCRFSKNPSLSLAVAVDEAVPAIAVLVLPIPTLLPR